MIKITKSFTRPNNSIEWWQKLQESVVLESYRITTYSSKMSNHSIVGSSDGLSWTYKVTWTSQEDYNAYLADPRVIECNEARKTYNAQNGIIESDTEITPID
jgi:hypothetical protein